MKQETIKKETSVVEVPSATKIITKENEVVKFNAETLIAKAIESQVPVETMERLLAMRKELKAEWAKEQYDKAMAKFQSECPTIVKTKEVKTKSGQVAYKYAPIESIVEQVKAPLQENGFSYSTRQEMLNDGVKVAVKVTHCDGHSEVTEMTVPLGTKTDIMSQTQVVAAASTFAKRYAFCNAFGILTGDEDTDAAPMDSKPAKSKSIPPSDKQLEHINRLINQKRMMWSYLEGKGFKESELTGGKEGTASKLIDFLMKYEPGQDEPQLSEIAQELVSKLEVCWSQKDYEECADQVRKAVDTKRLIKSEFDYIVSLMKKVKAELENTVHQEIAASIKY